MCSGGSLALLTIYAAVPSRRRLAAHVFVTVLIICTGYWRYLPFSVGAAIHELKVTRRFATRPYLGVAAVIMGIGLGVSTNVSAVEYYWQAVTAGHLEGYRIHDLIMSMAGILIVAGVLVSETSQSLLEKRLPLFLGRISYAMYLLHMPLLYTVFAWAYLSLAESFGRAGIVFWGADFFASTLLLAWYMTKFVDEPVTRMFRVRRSRNAVWPVPT